MFMWKGNTIKKKFLKVYINIFQLHLSIASWLTSVSTCLIYTRLMYFTLWYNHTSLIFLDVYILILIYISTVKCLKPDDLCLKYNSVRNAGISLHMPILPVCHLMYTYYWYVTSRAHIIGMSLHVHMLSVCYFMCPYCRYVTACMYYRHITSCAHTIGMSLHVHILSVCHFISTYHECSI